MTKKKRFVNQNLSSPSSPSLELDNRALKAKNTQLVQTVAKLQQEKTQQQNQISSLQEEYFKLNSKFMNLRNIIPTIDAATKQWFSKYVELSNMYTKIMQLCNVGMTVTNLNKDTRTQAVKPQIVNGHILHNPTINLSRLSDTNRSPSPRRHSLQRNNMRDNLSKPSTSRESQEEEEDGDSDNDEYDNENHLLEEPRFFSRRPVLSSTLVPLHLENVQEDSTEEEMDNEEEEANDEDNYCSRLITIQEEQEEVDDDEEEEADDYSETTLNSSKIYANRVREVRIFIDPLPNDCLKLLRNSKSKQSISIISSGSPLKQETSPLKQEASTSRNSKNNKSMSKRKSDYFCNSNTFEETTSNNSDVTGINDTFNPNNEFSGKLSVITNVPSCSTPYANSSNSFNTTDNSKEDIMKSLGLEPKLRLNTSSPLSAVRTRRKRKFVIYSDDDSLTPRLSKHSNINKRRGGSNEKVPHVILKRLSLEKKLSGSPIKVIGEVLNSSIITKASDMKRKSSKVKRSNSGSLLDGKRRSDSGGALSKEAGSGDCESGKHNISKSSPEDNRRKSPTNGKRVSVPLKKVQKRYLILSPQKTVKVSPRPKRAARPTAPLKELSLRKKMRRSK